MLIVPIKSLMWRKDPFLACPPTQSLFLEILLKGRNSAIDHNMVLPHLGKSEKGMVNTEYKRCLARIPKTYAITKLGYSNDDFDLEPVLIQPAYIQSAGASEQEIVRALKNL